MAETSTPAQSFKDLAKSSLSLVTSQPSPTPVTAEVDRLKTSPSQFIGSGVGQVTNNQYIKDLKAATGEASVAAAPPKIDTTLAKTYQSTQNVDKALSNVDAVKGTVSNNAQVEAATKDPATLAQLQLQAAQIDQAQKVQAPQERVLQEGETVSGAVDMSQAEAIANQTAQAAVTADPSKQATVQGQLESLMEGFEDGKTPAWAAGAIRNANAAMAARGLSSSSIAGQAILQAAMESAIPIASQDAQTYATFEQQNLSNRQQATMAAAAQRAQFLGQKFDQDFQAKVYNASKITEIANKNYDTSVQIVLENARLAQSVDLANLDAKNAKVLADAAALTQLDLANLSNTQQARVQNAQAFLQMDLANADRAQQTQLFKAQARVDSILSDTAAKNAAEQFNAKSQNETDQFMASLASSVEQFNAAQKNAMTQTNISEQNRMAQVRAQLEAERRAFNANNRLVIAQSNAEWRRTVATTNNATINEANFQDAQNLTTMTLAEYNAEAQARRDAMSYILTATENEKDRASEILMQRMAASAGQKAGMWEVAGAVVGNIAAGIDWGKLFK